MTGDGDSEIIGPEAEEALEAVRDTVDGLLYSFTEFDPDAFNPMYVADETIEYYGDREAMLSHFEEIHSYINLDFTEQQLFSEGLFPDLGEVVYLTTALEDVKLVRVYWDRVGYYVAVEPDEPVVPIAAAITAAHDEG